MIASASESDHEVTVPTVSPTLLPSPIGSNDNDAQREWEHYQVARGIERYRRTLVRETKNGQIVDRGLEESRHGQLIATDLIGPMVEAVKRRQQEYAERLADPALKKVPDAHAVYGILPAETIAACAVLTALANPVEAGWSSVKVSCAARLRHELEYQEWQRAEKAAEKERKAKQEDGVNLFKLMLIRNKNDIDKRVFDKWSKKSHTLITLQWSREQKVNIGGEVMELLVESNGWFQVKTEREDFSPRLKTTFGMTETALTLTAKLGSQCELQRPFMAPMICEPQDYIFLKSKANSSDEDD